MAVSRGVRIYGMVLLATGALGAAGMIALVAWVTLGGRPSGDQRARINRALAAAEARAIDGDARWHAALARRAELPPGEGACPVVAPPRPRGELAGKLGVGHGNGPDLDDWMRNVRAAQAAEGSSSEAVLPAARLAEAKSPRRRLFEHRRDALEHALADGTDREPAALVRDAEELAGPDFWTWDLVVVAGAQQTGGVDEEAKTFEGGIAVGEAYVFDYREGRVTCAGTAVATNSAVVQGVRRFGQGTAIYGELARDLEAQLLEAARAGLRGIPAGVSPSR